MVVKKKIGLVLGILIGVALVVTGSAWLYDRYASRQAFIDYPPPGQFVTVNGVRMHYLCQGNGEPTLVLEAGFDGGALDWTPILPDLAKHHRVCAFDRLGQDWSDAAPHPRTFSTAAEDLHAALETLGVKRPVVIGHSLGGALVQIYAAHYEVTGVILVEGLTSNVVEPVVERLGGYQAMAPLSGLGLLRPLGMFGADLAYPPEQRQQMMALRSRSSALSSLIDEGAVAAKSAPDELRTAEASLNGPLLVISAEQSDVPGLPEGAFVAAQKALADRIANSHYVFIPGATHHYIMAEHPQVVIEEIETWLVALQ